jgi:hypothetical protein
VGTARAPVAEAVRTSAARQIAEETTMRSRYAARTSDPDLSVELPGRLGTEKTSTGEQRASYKKTSLALALGQLGPTPLRETYQARAKATSAAQGCANCRGIETLKSCLAARGALSLQGVPVDDSLIPLMLRYCANLAGRDFGECPEAYYRSGLMSGTGGTDAPMNPFSQPWYPALRQNRQRLTGGGGGLYLAVTKQSANAHSVISRKTLEIGFRYGLCEYLAAVPSTGLRDPGQIVPQSLRLAGWDGADPNRVMLRWAELQTEFKDAYPGKGMLTGLDQLDLARRLLDSLQSDLSTSLRDRNLSWAEKKATLAGLCTLYRHLALSISSSQRRHAPDMRDFMSSVLGAISCANDESNAYTGSYDITNIGSDLGRLPAQGRSSAALQMINSIGLKWQNESSVEFGHQCGLCEDAQGEADLTRRLVDFAALHDGEIAPNPSFGVSFADLSLSAPAETVWDLANAVTCQAIEVFYAGVCKELVSGRPEHQQDFLTSLAYHCNQTAGLFIAYLEILFLELAYCNADEQPHRRVVKLLRNA